MPSMEPLRLQVWSDYVCPFCYLELPVLDRLSVEFGDRLRVEWRAFELRPEPVPTLDPAGEYLRSTWEQAVYPMARERGMTLRLPPVQPRSRRAFEAALFARSQERFAAMHEGLFRAFFEEGRDLADVGVLADVGQAAGLDPHEVRQAVESARFTSDVLEDQRLAHELGVGGVPAMRLLPPAPSRARELLVTGAQPEGTVRSLIEHMLDVPQNGGRS